MLILASANASHTRASMPGRFSRKMASCLVICMEAIELVRVSRFAVATLSLVRHGSGPENLITCTAGLEARSDTGFLVLLSSGDLIRAPGACKRFFLDPTGRTGRRGKKLQIPNSKLQRSAELQAQKPTCELFAAVPGLGIGVRDL